VSFLQVSEYVADRYVEGGSAAGAVYSSTQSPNELQVVVSGEKVNLRNFWSGQFASTWSVVLGAEATSVTVAGEVKVRAHYFEEGNVQLQTKKALPAVAVKVAGGDAAAVAKAVADHIAAEERQLQVLGFVSEYFSFVILSWCGSCMMHEASPTLTVTLIAFIVLGFQGGPRGNVRQYDRRNFQGNATCDACAPQQDELEHQRG